MSGTWIRGARRRMGWLALGAWALFAFLVLLNGRGAGDAQAQTAQAQTAQAQTAQAQTGPAAAPAALPGVPLGRDHAIGAATVVDNLTVFPIYAKQPEDLGEFTTLEAAMAAKTANVREAGAAAPGHRASSSNDPLVAQDAQGGARVDTVVIENRGRLPILVLAGTVVKGGNQDRQIGEDFVVAPGKTVDVTAFCVEHGRWNGTRDGKATDGQFVAQKSLALGSVRAAGQYDKDQSQVWSEVARVNAGSKKDAPSGTLLATLDDAQMSARRAQMATQLTSAMGQAPRQDKLVGVAYAVDGQVKGVRWFAGTRLFQLHKDTLLHTAAMEAIASSAGRGAGAAPPSASAPARAEAVAAFVMSMENEAVVERKAKADDSVSLKKSAAGYASETTVMHAEPAPAGAAPVMKPKSLSKDFVKK